MWLENRYLVPYLNGEPYSHKPPLLFWLMNAGWHLFGVNEWWPRLVAPLFGLGTMVMTGRLAKTLWPNRADVAVTARLLMFGALFWTVFTTLTMFDMMLAFFTIAALINLVTAARNGRLRARARRPDDRYRPVGKGSGDFVALFAGGSDSAVWVPHLMDRKSSVTWVWPEVVWRCGSVRDLCRGPWDYFGLCRLDLAGGEVYREAIFWGQSADRVVNSFCTCAAILVVCSGVARFSVAMVYLATDMAASTDAVD